MIIAMLNYDKKNGGIELGELIFTVCYGGALVVAGIIVKVVMSKQTSVKRGEEMAIRNKNQRSVI